MRGSGKEHFHILMRSSEGRVTNNSKVSMIVLLCGVVLFGQILLMVVCVGGWGG